MLDLHPDQKQAILDLRFDVKELPPGLPIHREYYYGFLDALALIWSDGIDTDPETYAHINSKLAVLMAAVKKYREASND